MARSTLRLPLSEWFSGSRSSSWSTPTTIDVLRSPSRAPARLGSGAALGRLRALGGGRQPAGHLLHLVGFDHVAHLDVLVALERDAALVAASDLASVLLEALQARDPPVVHDHVVAQEACLRAAHDLAVGHEATRHLPDARNDEGLTDLGASQHLLLERRLEQPFQRVAQLVQGLVDDGVETD